METHKGIEKAEAFLQSNFASSGHRPPRRRLAVTLSRQTGSGAWLVARELARLLDERAPLAEAHWTVFDKELVEKTLSNHNLPAKLAEFMPEDRVPFLQDAITEFLGLHPPSDTLTRATSETIVRLAGLGGVILIGRGSNILTARMGGVLHARLVGSFERRLQRVMELLHLDRKVATEFIEKGDRGHQRYLREHFKVEVDDPLHYDLVINTDRVSCERAALLLADELLARNPKAA